MIKKPLSEYLTLDSRPKIYLILVFVSLILLFYSVWQVKPVIVSPYDPLGLASHLPPYYWIGLALIVATSIFAFLDRELRKDAIFIIILIAVGLFLTGISVFVYESIREPTVYYPFSEVYNLLAARHIDIANPVHIGTYYSWPAYHFISASIVEITQAGFGFVRYGPLFWMLCFVLITYSTGKRLELAPNHCFLLSFLVLSSWVAGYAGAYNPRTLGMLFYLFVFMLLLTPRRTVAETGVSVLLFSALVLSHGLHSLVVLPPLILLSIYRKEPRFVILFIVILSAWTIYQAPSGIMIGIRMLTDPFKAFLELPQLAYPAASVMSRTVLRYSMLSYLAIYAALVTASAILLLKRRIMGQRRKQVISLFCWSIGVALVLALSYGTEGPYRIYILCLLPATGIIVLSFAGRRVITALMVTVMCLFAALNLPANHCGDIHWGQVLTSELKGVEFLAVKIEPKPSWVPRSYYNAPGGDQLIIHKDTSQLLVSNMDDSRLPKGPGGVDTTPLSGINYVVISKQGNDVQLYKWRNSSSAAWPETEDGQRANLLYNNGYFQIYENPQWESWLKSHPEWENWLRFKHF